MKEFKAKSLCILGRQPPLGLAELESLYGAEHIKAVPGAALLDIEAGDINFKKLGGTLRIAQLLSVLPSDDWQSAYEYLADNIPKHLPRVPAGTFTLGVSLYGLDVNERKLHADLLSLKKIIRASGRSVRIVPNKNLQLNTAQVLHNNLTKRGCWELLLLRDGRQTYLAQTFFVQDIEAYAARDQARPWRDARVGMLPPKLAQILLNLAVPKPPEKVRVLDPFCGTGVVLQEALLMGYHVIGTDIDPRLVEYSKTNIQWLINKYPHIEGQVVIEAADATNHLWPRFSAVASEVFLGRPLSSLPAEDKLRLIISDANTITKKFLQNLAGQLKAGQRLALAVPAWKTKNGFKELPVIDQLTDMGYNRVDFVHVKNSDLLYFREEQIVARRILVLEKAAK